MYTANSAAEQQELDGLFSFIGKIAKGSVRVAKKLALPVIAGTTGIPLGMLQSAGSPNQPYTGAGGAAVTPADIVNAQVQAMQAAQSRQVAARAPAGYAAPVAYGAPYAPVAGGLPKWALPVGAAVAVGGLALILLTRK